MKKRLAIITISISIVLVMLLSFVSCNLYKWGPVPGDVAGGAIKSNGGMVLEHGKYTYFINGLEEKEILAKSGANKFGVPVKGAIMRAETSKLYDKDCKFDTIVPKIVYSENDLKGIQIFGNWIYYTTTSTNKNADGEVQIDFLDYMRTTLDGSKTQKIATVKGANVAFRFTKNSLIYFKEQKIYQSTYNEKKVLKKEKVMFEKVDSVMFPSVSSGSGPFVDYFLFTQSDVGLSGNRVMVSTDDKSKVTELINGRTGAGSQSYSISLINYALSKDSNTFILYYTKGYNNGENFVSEGLYSYKFVNGDMKYSMANEKKLSDTTVSQIISLGFDEGILTMESGNFYLIKDVNDKKLIAGNLTNVSLLFVDETVSEDGKRFLYYIYDSKIFKIDILDAHAMAIKVNKENVTSSWKVEMIGDNIFFFSSTLENYMHIISKNSVADSEDYKAAQMIGKIKPVIEKIEEKE